MNAPKEYFIQFKYKSHIPEIESEVVHAFSADEAIEIWNKNRLKDTPSNSHHHYEIESINRI